MEELEQEDQLNQVGFGDYNINSNLFENSIYMLVLKGEG